MNTYQELEISAYMSPRPLDEDTFLEEEWISWLPGYIKEETEDGLESYFNESNIELYERIEHFTAALFKKATERMWPLLNEHHFKKIYIGIDYSNTNNKTSLAGYEYDNSKPGKGIYYFTVDQNLIGKYSAFLNEKIESLPNINLWEHELIHLLDHWEILKASSFAGSRLPLNNLKYYALKYREEGIANLLDLLDGKINGVNSREEAKKIFAEKYKKTASTLLKLDKTTSQDRKEAYSGYDFYEVGPWIILDMLEEILFVTDLVNVEELENKIVNGEKISEELKLEIIRNAFHIDIEWFMSRLGNYCELH
jgi:hypothetical protein